jgi:predicted nucleic acid-binding protein
VPGAILIDTDVLIDAGRGVSEAVERLKKHEQQSILAISVITRLELIVGCRNKQELQKLDKFLRRFTVVKLEASASDIVVELITAYRLSHGLLIPDALIAATALANQIPLLTKNQRDYRFIPKLQLLPYP